MATQQITIPVDGDVLLSLQVAKRLRDLAQTNFDTLANAIATSNVPDWKNSDDVSVSEDCTEIYLTRTAQGDSM